MRCLQFPFVVLKIASYKFHRTAVKNTFIHVATKKVIIKAGNQRGTIERWNNKIKEDVIEVSSRKGFQDKFCFCFSPEFQPINQLHTIEFYGLFLTQYKNLNPVFLWSQLLTVFFIQASHILSLNNANVQFVQSCAYSQHFLCTILPVYLKKTTTTMTLFFFCCL